MTFFKHYILCCTTVVQTATLHVFLQPKHSCASCIPRPNRSPPIYSIPLDCRVPEVMCLQMSFIVVCSDSSGSSEGAGNIVCLVFGLCLRFKLDPQLHRQDPAESWTWAEPTGAALKLPWSYAPWLNVDPLFQMPSEQCCLWHCYIHSPFVSITTLKFKKWSQQLKPVLQSSGEINSSSNPSARSSCHRRSPSLFFTLLPCARQYCTCNGWLVSNIWLLLLEPKLWEIALLAAPDALS